MLEALLSPLPGNSSRSEKSGVGTSCVPAPLPQPATADSMLALKCTLASELCTCCSHCQEQSILVTPMTHILTLFKYHFPDISLLLLFLLSLLTCFDFPSQHLPLSDSISVTQSCLTLCNRMNYSPPNSSVHGFSRQEYQSGLPFTTPRGFPDSGIEPMCPAWQVDSLPLSHQGSPIYCLVQLLSQSCQTLCDPMDCSLLGSSLHGIFQARILELVVISFSKIYNLINY